MGVAAGTELLAHTARALTEADPELVLFSLDAKNAYGTADRAACLRGLVEVAPELRSCAELFCRRESQYLFWDSAGCCHCLRAMSDGYPRGLAANEAALAALDGDEAAARPGRAARRVHALRVVIGEQRILARGVEWLRKEAERAGAHTGE